jgi:hypothetical protein
MFTVLRQLIARKKESEATPATRRCPTRKLPPARRPELEALEQRLVLSSLGIPSGPCR